MYRVRIHHALLAAALAVAGCGPSASPDAVQRRAAATLGASWYAAAPYVMPVSNDPPDLSAVMAATGQKSFMLAFILAPNGGGCTPTWDGVSPVSGDTAVKAVIDRVRANGGDVSVAVGGYGGTKLGQVCGSPAATAAAYQQVIDRYALRAIDFDLEEPEIENSAAIHNELGAAQILQRNNPGLYVSVTMPATATGVNWFGGLLLDDAKSLGFTPDNYSIMPFDGGFNGAAAQIAAVEGLKNTLMSKFGWDAATAYAHAGISMMNGRSDTAEYFYQADFQTVLDWALSKKLGRYTYWSVNRDRECSPPNNGVTSGVCSSVAQRPWEFTTYTARFAGAGPVPNDTVPPSVPTGLVSTGKTSSSVSLAWTASTDNVGVAGYDVYRNGARVGSPAGTSYTDTGLAASTAYSYTVRARDAAGNASAQSGALSVTTSSGGGGTCTAPAWDAAKVYLNGDLVSYGNHTWKALWWTQNEIPGVTTSGVWVDQGACSGGGDTTAPSVPTGLNSPAKTSSSVSLAWTASTDNVGVAGYDVYRNGAQVGSPSGTSFTDSGLSASTTYSYTVRARDAAGNASAQSGALSVTTSSGGGGVTLPVGSLVTFDVTTSGYTDRVLRHQSGGVVTSVINASSDATSRLDATYYVRAPLAAGAASNCYSFESLNFPNEYLRHYNYALRKDAKATTDIYAKDATFCARTGLSGGDVSLESFNMPGYFIRHASATVYAASATGTNAWDGGASFNADATWKVVTGLATEDDKDGGGGGTHVMAYFAQWGIYQRAYYVRHIDTSGSAAKLDAINYAFGNVVNNRCSVGVTLTGVGDAWADYQKGFDAASSVDGVADAWDQKLKGNWNQLKKLKAKYPKLKVLMSLGGWTWSDGFYSAARAENRAAFVASCIDAYIKGNLPVDAGSATGGAGVAAGVFDGIDLDWEYPVVCGNNPSCGASAADKANFTALLAEFRRQLDAVRPGLLLTVAVGAGEDKIQHYDIPGVAQYTDRINLMTYDFFGAWASTGPTAFHSPLRAWSGMPSSAPLHHYTSDFAVQAWKAGGAPASKLHLGIPFYGRGWTGVTNSNNGLNQQASGPAPGTWEAGIEDYKKLKALGWPTYTSAEAGTAWIFNGSTFYSFDTPATIATKMSYARAQGLGGAFAWELDGDDASGSLLAAMRAGLQ